MRINGSIPHVLGAFPAVRKNRHAKVYHVAAGDGNLQAAIDKCVADQGDIIVVQPGNHNLTTALDINKRGIFIVAAGQGGDPLAMADSFLINFTSGVEGAVAVITDPCTIIGLSFTNRADADQPAVTIDCEEAGGFSGGGVHFMDCRFMPGYGINAYGLYTIGGSQNRLTRCRFDGLFSGWGTAAIGLDIDGSIDPAYTVIEDCEFHGTGSGIPAIKWLGANPLSQYYVRNALLPGFTGNQGILLDGNSLAGTGIAADNMLAPLANQAAAFTNMGSASGFGYSDNHYEEA